MTSSRIVITGMGAVSPLGCGIETIWRRLLEGKSGIRLLPEEISGPLSVKIAGQVPTLEEDPEGGFDPDLSVSPKDQKKMDRFILFAMAAADEALQQAGWHPQTLDEQERTATVIGSGIGGFPAIAHAVRTSDSRGPKRLSPFTIPSFLVNLAAGHVSIKHKLKGPIGAPVTACAAGVQAVGDAVRMLRNNEADIAVSQQIAVTGSVDQFGNVQPIGGVNEKIEGFFEVCQRRGFTQKQGVIIPATNVRHLCLNQEVVDAVREGQFHIWAVDSVIEALPLLTGYPYADEQQPSLLAAILERIAQANQPDRRTRPWILGWMNWFNRS